MERFSPAAGGLALVTLLLVLLARHEAVAQYMPPVVDPKTYRAPSGRYELTLEPRKFDLFFAAASQRVSFSVTQGTSGGWTVKETARAPHTLAALPEPTLLSLRKETLKPIKPLLLPTRRHAAPSPIHDVHSFAFDDRGRIAFLRKPAGDIPELVLVDQAGVVLRQVVLKTAVKGESTWSGPACVGGRRFVIANSENNAKAKGRAFWVDAETGHYDEFLDFDCPRVNGMVGFSDGSFAALGTDLTAFDKQGRETLTVRSESSTGKPEILSHPKAIATSNEEILVLEYGEPQVKCFDREGKFLRIVNVKSVNGENGIPWTIFSDIDSGFIVDSARLKADGTLRERLAPKYTTADSSTFEVSSKRHRTASCGPPMGIAWSV
jgi:hypothetical protein